MNNHFTIQRQLLFTRIMRQSLCLHEALTNIAITSETRKACFISLTGRVGERS